MSRPIREPDHRARAVITAVSENRPPQTEDPLANYFFHYVKGEAIPDGDFVAAAELYADEEYKHILNALLLGRATPDQIHNGLDIPLRVLDHYSSFFFDVQVFPHNPARIRYINQLPADPGHVEHYRMAVERGPEEVIRRYRVGWRPRISPKAVTEQLVDDMTARFNTHRGQSIVSDQVREALRWGEAAMRGAKQLHEFERDALETENASNNNELKIALTVETVNSAPKDVGISVDQLVKS